MAGACKKENCYPEETGCNFMGCEVLTDCEFYKSATPIPKKSGEETPDEDFFIRMPWTGNSLGLNDLEYLAASSNLIMVGLAGVANAGKTTFLATLYCLLRNGGHIGAYRFAGSLTLAGWENIAWYLSWKRNNDIQFPPHTTSNAGRVPGLLHLKLADKVGNQKDLVFTDAPGEWFDHWSYHKHDPNAAGVNWIHENADAYLLFADCEMLAGNELGKARRQTRLVADRLKDGLNTRPLAMVWSKSDINLDADIKKQLSAYVNNAGLTCYEEFETSVREGVQGSLHQNICKSIAWLLEKLAQQQLVSPSIVIADPDDLFLSKR